MCGIAGQIRTDGQSVDRALLDSMCKAFEHRGPDSRGVHIDGGVGLAIQRLRVVDLETGDQPIYNEDRSVVVVLNGEIYNFRELRKDLRRRGHRFGTNGDTEVIVHLYEDVGADCVKALQGMFAFALYDFRRRQLLVARDRVGKKPLFYALRQHELSFASEIIALMHDPGVSRELDHQAMDCFFAYGYVPSPMSAFRAVRKLPPASRLIYSDGTVTIDRYWKLDYATKGASTAPEDVEEQTRSLIKRAVERRMIADVPIGAFLSGGIDSSAVVAAMAQASPRPVRTFSIGFKDEDFNELVPARLVARLFGTEHREFTVEPDAVELMPRLVRHYGEPFGDSSAIPSFYLAEMARQYVTVALNGDGGDESFGGYVRYTANALAARLDRLPPPIRWAVSAAGERIPLRGEARTSRNRVVRIARSLAFEGAARYRRYVTRFQDEERNALYTPEYRELIGESLVPQVIESAWRDASGSTAADRVLETDVETYLPDDLLVKIDIATMAHSLEGRSPLLDPEVMQFAASQPPSLKLSGMERKVLLRKALKPWLPAEILNRRKMGFDVPVGAWFRGELREYVREVLLDRAATGRGYFEPKKVASLIERHQSGVEDASNRIWLLLVHEWWHRIVVDASPPVPSASIRAG